MQKFLPLIGLIALFSTGALAQSAPESAEDTVRAIVGIQADAVNNGSAGGHSSPWFNGKDPTPDMKKYYTRAFVAIWKCAASGHENAWDGDFITGLQNITSERLISTQQISSNEDTTLINADIEDQRAGVKGTSHIQFSLERESGTWKVDDVIELDYIAHNEKNKSQYMEPSQRKALENYPCE